MTADASLPAWSVAVSAIPFVPALSGILRVNVPSLLAVAVADVPLASLRATTDAPAWVFPLMVALARLIVAPFFGEVIVIFGFAVSRT
jgi:hypothetical protein